MNRILLAIALLPWSLASCLQEQDPGVGQAAPPATPEPELAAVEQPQTDPDSGLRIDEHWELVKAHCSACHSPRLVTQNRGSRNRWLAMIRWMQDSQGLWQFDPLTEKAILDYLEKNYAPAASHRRAPLDPALMPANPYGSG